jgi:DHA3 family macrolide efflux protein-like MFS transporter
MTLFAPMASGLLLSKASIVWIFYIDVITAAVAVFILLFAMDDTVTKTATSNEKSYFYDLSSGLGYIRKNSFLIRYILFSLFFLIFASPLSFLTGLQVTRKFGEEVWRLTAIEITFSVGTLIGGFVMSAWGGFKNRIYSMALSSFIISLCTILLGLASNFTVYLGIMVLCGLVLPLFNISATVLLQAKVDRGYMGRVFGVFGMIQSFVVPMSMLFFGPLADIFLIDWILIATGGLMSILALYMVLDRVLKASGIITPEKQE